ncbi:MAG: MFS transporter [Candidatus Latescibacteria bacterium]|nr:MFS transporter [Candidatus Latescibacterota bacterium]
MESRTTITHTTCGANSSQETAKGIYRGWYIAFVSALSLGAVLGTAQFAFSLFILPLEEAFGWSRTQVNGALTCGVVSGLLSPFIGNLMDRLGAKWTMVGSITLVAIAFLLRAVMTELWQFYLFSALMFTGMPGATMMPAGRLVNIWFPRIRGRMMGFVTGGNNLGSMIAIPIVAGLITMVGWRGAFAAMAIGLLAMAVLVALVIRDGNDDVKKEQNKRWAPSQADAQEELSTQEGLLASEATRTSAFWLLGLGMMLQQFLRTGVVSQMVPHLQQVGFSLASASGAMMMLAFFGFSSKLIFGRLSETITARLAFVVILILQGIGLVVLIVAGGSMATWGGLVVLGLGMGGVGALTPLVIADIFGLKQFGSIMGLTSVPIIVPVFLGPILAGVIFDSTGDYNLMFLITLGMLIVSVGAFMLVKVPANRKTELANGLSGG